MGDKKKKKVEKVLVGDVDTSELKFPKLQEFAAILLKKLNTARKERVFLQAQCSQMRTAWEMTKLKLQDTKYQIKATAMNRDKIEVEVCGEVIKEMSQVGKYVSYNLNETLNQLMKNTGEMLKDNESKWEQSHLSPLIEQKTDLKQKVEFVFERDYNAINDFQKQINTEITNYIDSMDKETERIIENNIQRYQNNLCTIRLISETSFFRMQEEYNRVIRELISNGLKNTNMMREFYKRITEDDIILILVLERQVRKLKGIVTRKQIMCKKINDQTAVIESSKGKLDINLRRAKRKMKLYDTNTLALDRASFMCDKLTDKKNINAKELKEVSNNETDQTEKLKKLKDYIGNFNELFEKRQKEVLEPLRKKLKILHCLIVKDRETIESIMTDLPPDTKEDVRKKWEASDSLAYKCLSHLVFDMTRLCSTHDTLINFVEGGVTNLSIPIDRVKFKRINFDALSYGQGPVGLITKYP